MWKRSYGRLTKAPPDERGGNRHGRPNATAPHPDSTRTGRSKRHARFLSGFAFGLIARVAQLAVLAGGSPLGPCLGSGRFLLTRSFTSGNLRLSEDRLIRQKAIGAAADDFRNRVERRSSPSPWRTGFRERLYAPREPLRVLSVLRSITATARQYATVLGARSRMATAPKSF